MLTLLKGHIFCVKHAVKLLVPSSRNESPAQVANIHSVMTLRAVRQMSFYDIRNGSSDPYQLHSD